MKRHTLRRRYGRAMVDAKSMARDLHAAGSLAVHDPRTGSSFTITTFGRQGSEVVRWAPTSDDLLARDWDVWAYAPSVHCTE